jgi:hypothetical protein
MTDTVPWIHPGDGPVDKARWIARQYRHELNRLDPDLCRHLDEASRRLGQTWITPELVRFDDDDWITIAEAAELVFRTPRAVRYWTTSTPPKLDSITDNKGVKRVRVKDLIDLERDLRERRAGRPT